VAYLPIALPENTPPLVQSLIRGAVEPFLQDVHVMFRLPVPSASLNVGCNLSIAQILLSAISGVSAVLYSTTESSGSVFRDFLIHCYPWDSEPVRENSIRGADAARILYEEYRNPLTHASGTPVFAVMGQNRREYIQQQHRLSIDRVAFAKHKGEGLPEERINELESEPVRPPWLPVTLASDSKLRKLTVEALYWGFRCAVRNLCDDTDRMQAAVRFFEKVQSEGK